MTAELKEQMENSIKLLRDSKYIPSIVPQIDNTASKTDNFAWLKEIKYSITTYHLEKDISDRF